jgi:hypothetical protein
MPLHLCWIHGRLWSEVVDFQGKGPSQWLFLLLLLLLLLCILLLMCSSRRRLWIGWLSVALKLYDAVVSHTNGS